MDSGCLIGSREDTECVCVVIYLPIYSCASLLQCIYVQDSCAFFISRPSSETECMPSTPCAELQANAPAVDEVQLCYEIQFRFTSALIQAQRSGAVTWSVPGLRSSGKSTTLRRARR